MVAATLPKTRRIELILRQVDQLPTLPAVATRLLELTADSESRSDEVVSLVASDPALTARVLAMCRTADKGVRHSDTLTVERAVLLLGYSQVRNIVLSVKVFELFAQTPEAGGDAGQDDEDAVALDSGDVLGFEEDPRSPISVAKFDRPGFWTHCLGVAVAAERIAATAGDKELPKDEAFVCGLLHDLGKIALSWVLPKAYDRVAELAQLHQDNIADHERSLIGVDHHTAGKRLAEQWKLPHRLQDTLWLHGSPYETLPKLPHRRMIGLVQLADLVVRQRHLGYSGNHATSGDAAALAASLGLDPVAVDAALAGLFDDVQRRAQAMGLNEQVSVDLYLQSVQRANEALGRSNAVLEKKARSATGQGHVLSAIAKFHGQAIPGRSVQDVIDAVATSAFDLMGPGFYAVIHPTRHGPSAALNMADEAATLEARNDAEAFDQQLVGGAGASSETNQEDGVESSETSGGGESWLICQYDAQGQPLRARYVERPPQAPDLSDLDPQRGTDMKLMAVLPWIADTFLEAEDLQAVSLMPLPSGWGASAVLLHDRQELPAWEAMSPIVSAWGTAIAAANQHDGARRLGEQLAQANTELAEAQAEITRTQSMARLGEMASGAAHEMNNPLAIISGRSQLLTMSLDGGSKEHQAANAIFRESHRLSDLITAMRMFANPPKADRQLTDLPKLLSEVMNKVSTAAKRRREDLEFGVQLSAEFPKVSVDPQQVDRAVTELLMNAVQAEPRRGVVVKARLENHDLPGDAEVGDDTATGVLVIQVIDDGEGMDSHTLAHAADPFFSAKSAGRQVGMGLSRVAQLAEAHGGRIDLRSTPGRGTTATLTLRLA